MKAKQKSRLVYLAAFLLILVIIGYNIWSYCAGYCTAASLMAFSLPAQLLLAGIAVATVFLLSCKSKNRQLQQQHSCGCGSELRDAWDYCPLCGQSCRK